MTSIDLTLQLSERLARDAEAAGLLSPRAVAKLLRAEIKRKAATSLLAGAARASEAGSAPLSMDELQEIVDSVRAERRSADGRKKA